MMRITGIALSLLVAIPAFAQAEPASPGPHTLVISDRQGMTRIDYPTGAKCLRARDAIRKQTAPPPNTPGVIYGRSSVKAFCVPR
jgi:hypothetical protein